MVPPIAVVASSATVVETGPQPFKFHGERKANVMENIIWDMELYFNATRIPPKDQVATYTAYFMGDTKLWWRTQLAPRTSVGRGSSMLCDELKTEI